MFKKQQQKKTTKPRLLYRLKSGLSKTRVAFQEAMVSPLLGKKVLSENFLEGIETNLLTSDVGVAVTEKIIADLTNKLSRKELKDGNAIFQALKTHLINILSPVEKPLEINSIKKPFVILVVGVNGSGKTTTIGKLAKQLQNAGLKVMLAAGDTFRAAAIEQLQVWGERNNIPVITQQSGADSAAVIFDAVQSATARQMDVLIADTAGRLHTQSNLMEELKKINRVIKKIDENAPHEVLLTLDAGIGQNTLQQAKYFNNAVNITGIVLTKLDGTAKGGVIFALADQLGLPIRFIGIGEQIDDLRSFHANEFVEALFTCE